MLRFIPPAATVVATLVLAACPATAARRHRHPNPQGAVAAAPASPQPFMFYPQTIEGGVSGNLPFNNQIRKHTDPLNANGGR